MFQAVFLQCLPYFGCVLLGVDSLRGGLAKGNRIFQIRFFFEVLCRRQQNLWFFHNPLYKLYFV